MKTKASQKSEWSHMLSRIKYIYGTCGECGKGFESKFTNQFFCNECRTFTYNNYFGGLIDWR